LDLRRQQTPGGGQNLPAKREKEKKPNRKSLGRTASKRGETC